MEGVGQGPEAMPQPTPNDPPRPGTETQGRTSMDAGPARRALPGGVLIRDDPMPDLARLLDPPGTALIIQRTR